MDKITKKIKQISAFVTIIIIIALYITTLVLALMDNKYTQKFFIVSLFSSVFIPIMVYVMFWLAGVLKLYNPTNPDNPSVKLSKIAKSTEKKSDE